MISDLESKTVGIVGGNGGMGKWFSAFFRERGFPVLISDLDTELRNEELVGASDIVLLATPISVTPGLVRTLGPLFTEKQLLADLTSIKTEVMEAMLTSSASAVLGLHPLYGPHTGGIFGQNMILVPGRGEEWAAAFRDLFEKDGCAVYAMDASDHDKHMSFVQGIMHFFSISLGAYMQKTGLDAEMAHKVATPTSRLCVTLVRRLFSFDLDLYAELIIKNPHMEETLRDFSSVCEESTTILFHGEPEERKKWLRGIREFLGPFSGKALEESNRILDFSSGRGKSFFIPET